MRLPILLLILSIFPVGACAAADDLDAPPPPPSAAESTAPTETGVDTCEPVPPRRLPSGAKPGGARPFASDYGSAVAWGEGKDRLVQLPGGNPLGLGRTWPERVTFRRSHARITAIGDPGEIAFVFKMNDCTYTNWIGPGIRLNDAEAYIATY